MSEEEKKGATEIQYTCFSIFFLSIFKVKQWQITFLRKNLLGKNKFISGIKLSLIIKHKIHI